jgi:hypothetical protein
LVEGVNVAVAPFVVTTPDTAPPPPLSLKVLVVKVDPFISREKVADTVVLTATPVALFDGLVEFIVRVTGIGVGRGPPPTDMVNALLTADVNPVLDAVRFFEPSRLMLKLLNVARPLAFVVVVVVPLSTPVPEDNAIAIETPAVDTLLLLAFCSCTVTGGLIVSPGAALDGCWAKTTFVASTVAVPLHRTW